MSLRPHSPQNGPFLQGFDDRRDNSGIRFGNTVYGIWRNGSFCCRRIGELDLLHYSRLIVSRSSLQFSNWEYAILLVYKLECLGFASSTGWELTFLGKVIFGGLSSANNAAEHRRK